MVYFLPIIPAVDPGPDGSGGGLLGVLLFVNLFFNGIPCVLTALALWRTARWRGIVRPWLALIPVADLWVLGSLSDLCRKQKWGKNGKARRELPLLGGGALGSILLVAGIVEFSGLWQLDILAFLLALAVWGVFLVKRTVALCEVYQGFAPRQVGWYIALSIVCPLLIPLFIFKCRW